MFKLPQAIALLSLIIMSLGVFQLKYYVKALQYDIREVRRQIVEEKDTINVLKAEWAYLNKPERLRQLADRHLKLEPIAVAQLVNQNMPENFAIVNKYNRPVMKLERTIVKEDIIMRANLQTKQKVEKIKWDEKRKRFIIKDR